MTSIQSADNPYYVEGPSARLHYEYRAGSVMSYIYQKCPVFALCAQKSGHDKWIDSPEFDSTCFVPSQIYSNTNFACFQTVDYSTARDLVLTSTIARRIPLCALRVSDYLPTYKNTYLHVWTDCEGRVLVNGLPIKESIECDNGMIHILDGFVSLEENYLN